MELGTQTNSLVNHFLSGTKGQPEPEVGMGATLLCWTDRQAHTIVEVLSPRRIVVKRDNVKRTDSNGMSEDQSYTYETNNEATSEVYTKRKNGGWYKAGASMKDYQLRIGDRREYHDFGF